MADEGVVADLVARIERLEAHAARAGEREARLEEPRGHGALWTRGAGAPNPSGPPRVEGPSPRPSRRGFFNVAVGAAGITAVGTLALGPRGATRVEAATGGLPVYNVRDYGAAGDGSTDDTTAINNAILDAANAGGGVVYVPAGSYRVTPHPHPQNGAYAPCVLMRSGVVLRGAGRGASTIRLTDNAALPSGSALIVLSQNADISVPSGPGATRDEAMVVEDVTFDGNAGTQTAPAYGILWIGCRGVYHHRVRVRNVYGTGSDGSGGGIAETFFYEFQLGAEAFYDDCEAVTTDASNTASGFSADNATSVAYAACVARAMKFSSGFTHNNCAVVRYTDCHSYGNGVYGFNSEVTEDVRYNGCVAGGRADAAGQGVFSANQSLGNRGAGFVFSASKVVDLIGCSSRYNGSHGAWIANGSDGVRVLGGEYSNNGGRGVQVTSDATNIAISHETRATGNTQGALQSGATVNAANPFAYDSGWIAASSDTLLVAHGLPNRPRFVTLYVGGAPAPSDTTLVRTYTGPIYASGTQLVAHDVTSGDTYRFVAVY